MVPWSQLPWHHAVPGGPEPGTDRPTPGSRLRHLLELKLKLIPLVCFLVLKLQLLALLFSIVQERWWVAIQIGKI